MAHAKCEYVLSYFLVDACAFSYQRQLRIYHELLS